MSDVRRRKSRRLYLDLRAQGFSHGAAVENVRFKFWGGSGLGG